MICATLNLQDRRISFLLNNVDCLFEKTYCTKLHFYDTILRQRKTIGKDAWMTSGRSRNRDRLLLTFAFDEKHRWTNKDKLVLLFNNILLCQSVRQEYIRNYLSRRYHRNTRLAKINVRVSFAETVSAF